MPPAPLVHPSLRNPTKLATSLRASRATFVAFAHRLAVTRCTFMPLSAVMQQPDFFHVHDRLPYQTPPQTLHHTQLPPPMSSHDTGLHRPTDTMMPRIGGIDTGTDSAASSLEGNISTLLSGPAPSSSTMKMANRNATLQESSLGPHRVNRANLPAVLSDNRASQPAKQKVSAPCHKTMHVATLLSSLSPLFLTPSSSSLAAPVLRYVQESQDQVRSAQR